jgi:hypothetical protein
MGKHISEASVSSLTGLSRERLRDLRGSLTKGDDWHFGKNGEVEFTQAGLAAIMELIRERVSFGDLPAEKTAPAATADLVMSFPCLSRYWVKAVGPGDDRRVVRVRVRDNSNLRRGMVLKNCALQADGTWSFPGRCA